MISWNTGGGGGISAFFVVLYSVQCSGDILQIEVNNNLLYIQDIRYSFKYNDVNMYGCLLIQRESNKNKKLHFIHTFVWHSNYSISLVRISNVKSGASNLDLSLPIWCFFYCTAAITIHYIQYMVIIYSGTKPVQQYFKLIANIINRNAPFWLRQHRCCTTTTPCLDKYVKYLWPQYSSISIKFIFKLIHRVFVTVYK